jgi:hypothetical protein
LARRRAEKTGCGLVGRFWVGRIYLRP